MDSGGSGAATGGGWIGARMVGGAGMGYGSGSNTGISGGAGKGPSLIGGR
jgi:hypothetical protein